MDRYVFKPGGKDRGLLFAIILYLAPTLLLVAVFQLLPIIQALFYSFQKINLMSGKRVFVGARNYLAMARDMRFLGSIATTLEYLAMRVPAQVALGFLLALLIAKPRRWTGFMRTILLLPVITSMVVVTSIMGLMMHPSNGLINSILSLFGAPALGFVTDPDQALASIAFITVWKNVGLTMLFFLAGLMAIPPSLYEAAMIDGASAMQKIRYVTIPLLAKTFSFVLMTTTINAFQVFSPVLLMTNGGPSDSTRVVVMDIYENAFVYNQMGYASAQSIILAMILIAVSVFQMKIAGPGRRVA